MAAGQSEGSADKGSDKPASGKARSDEAVSGKAVSGKAGPAKAVSAKAGSTKAGRDDGAAPGDMDDLKRKFREALDRKKDQHAGANAEGTQTTGKVHDAHGPASSRRSFRRKSGS
jgi:hypothetical protein